ncbi:MAG: hypothetical protein PHS19_04540 [Eubacteriales bacterium]|nr:hypothetical protein [Eubacteriales bacterium]
MMLDIESLYFEVKSNVDRVCFDKLWYGFSPLKFALYTDANCFLDGRYIDKPKEFVANTSVLFEGEYIAIWHVVETMDPMVLAAKIIHEMFHAFQNIRGESRFPDELEALSRYQYDEVNLSLKYNENKILLALADDFDRGSYTEFLSIRSYRRKVYPYEFYYEAAIEEIEGSAQYVELNALKQLSEELFAERIMMLKERILMSDYYFPIRISCYDVGALLFRVLKINRLLDFEECSDVLSTESILTDFNDCIIDIKHNTEVAKGSERYRTSTLEMIRRGIDNGMLIDEGEIELLGVNVYNARCAKGYIISTHFVFYRKDGHEKVQYGDFMIKLVDSKRGSKIYKLQDNSHLVVAERKL